MSDRPDIEQILAKVDDAMRDWYACREEYDLTDDIVTEGTDIINAARKDSNG